MWHSIVYLLIGVNNEKEIYPRCGVCVRVTNNPIIVARRTEVA